MASIRKHGRSWQVRVRRHGFPIEIKTFSSKAEAECIRPKRETLWSLPAWG